MKCDEVTKHPTEITLATSFSEIAEQDWQSLDRDDFVFADYRFLHTLEITHCLGNRTGWHPRIFLLKERSKLVAALPMYLKTNSYGEFVFDWSWAHISEQLGVPYYPKLVSAAPFTPATGPKFLISRGYPRDEARRLLIDAATRVADELNVGSVHYLFTTPEESRLLGESGHLIRHSYQYHWQNQGWANFDDYLSALRRKRRAEIRRERQAAARLPIRIERLTGVDLRQEHAQSMYELYLSTHDKMGGLPYLTESFFTSLFERMPEHILLVRALDLEGRCVAASMNLYSGTTLFGRYWGSRTQFKNLHFELCYYQTIEWAIARGFQIFEAGAQGEHKFNRGFLPNLCFSAHKLRHPGLAATIELFIENEKKAIEHLLTDYEEHSPFKKEGGREP